MLPTAGIVTLAVAVAIVAHADSLQQQDSVLINFGSGGTFISGTYYPRKFKAVYLRDNCPPAVCEENCLCIPVWRTGCPFYICDGTKLREPCISDLDCAIQGHCQRFICRYFDPILP
uniref:Uncharacterized protein n=1 Tax=Trichuris muris TaxID=70415 RepID=A0A5S6QGQ7_TRIMR